MTVFRRRPVLPLVGLVAAAALGAGCRAPAAPPSISPRLNGADSLYDPARDLGQLFHDIQLARVYPDSKTLVDARPRQAPADIVARYAAAMRSGPVDLKAFVAENFDAP